MRRFLVRGAGSNGLNLRSAPGLGSRVVGTLDDETLVLAEGNTSAANGRAWRRVLEPREGFVADAYLDPISDASCGPPAAAT